MFQFHKNLRQILLIFLSTLIISNAIVLFEGFILLYFRILYGKKEEINN